MVPPVNPNQPQDWLNIGGMLKSYQNSLTAKSAISGNDPRALMMNTRINWNTPPGGIVAQSNRGGPSVVSRIFDLLSRANYGVAEGARQLAEHPTPGQSGMSQAGDVLHGIVSGLAGTRKTTFSDVVKEAQYNQHPQEFVPPADSNAVKKFAPGMAQPGEKGLAGGLGLLGDIFLDPTTYIGPGAIKSAGKIFGIGKKAEAAALAAKNAPIGTQGFASLPKPVIRGTLPPTNQVLPPGLNRVLQNIPTPPPSAANIPVPPIVPIDVAKIAQNIRSGTPFKSLAPEEQAAYKSHLAQDTADDIARRAARKIDPVTGRRLQPLTIIPHNINTAKGFLASLHDQGHFALAALASSRAKTIDEQIAFMKKGANGINYFGKMTDAELQQYKRMALAEEAAKTAKVQNPPPSAIPTPPIPTGKVSGLPAAPISKASVLQRMPDSTFPHVPIDTAAHTIAGKTNAEIKALVSTLAENPVKGLGKMNKTKLSEVLAQHQGVPALSKTLSTDFNTAQKMGGSTLDAFAKVLKLPPKALKVAPPGVDVKVMVAEQAKAAKLAEETQAALDAAKKYESSTLTKPNQFATKPGVKPAVNNPAQQTNLFNDKILPKAKELYPKYTHAGQMVVAHRMLKTAEDYLTHKGLHPKFGDGSALKLSDVMSAFPGGPGKISKVHLTQLMLAFKSRDLSKITDPKLKDLMHQMITTNKLKEIPYVDQALQSAGKTADHAQQILSNPKYEAFKKNLQAQTKANLSSMPIHISPASRNLVNNSLSTILKSNITVPQKAILSQKTAIYNYVKSSGKGQKWAAIQRKQTQAINKTIKGPSPAKLGTAPATTAATENWLLSRIATWYGNKTLRPDVMIATQSAAAKAVSRAKVLNDVAKNFDERQIAEAFQVAQGHLPSAQSADITHLGQTVTKMIEDMYHYSGLNQHALGNTVASRAGIFQDEINKQLRMLGETFQFSSSAKTPNLLGGVTDFSKGINWVNSWRVAKTNDPLTFISKLQTATEQITAKYSFLDEISARYGSSTKANGFSESIAHPRFNGTYFHPDMASEIGTVLKNWDSIYDPKSPLMKYLDQATSIWKTGVTIYAPSHHIRNIIGDVYMSWMAGVNNPNVYRLSARVLMDQKGRYKDVTNINDLVGKDALTLAGKGSATKPLFRTKGGIDVTSDQVYIGALQHGLLQSVNEIEDITKPFATPKPFGGHFANWVKGKSETREHYAKIAHFIDAIQKGRGGNLEEIMRQASKEVRKWHPDGMDLTNFERKYLRRIFPFYSWTRKAIPLIVESAVLHPGKTVLYPKVMQNAQVATGTEGPSRSDPFPEDQLFPNWIKEKGIGPITKMGASGPLGFLASLGRSRLGVDGKPEGYTVANPGNPFTDVISQFGGMGNPKDLVSGLGQMLNPGLRIPAEVTTGTTMLGTPTNYDPNKYITENVPGLAYLSQLGNVGIFGPTNRGQKEGVGNMEGLVNFLTALGLRGTGASIKEAEFEAKQRAKNGGK